MKRFYPRRLYTQIALLLSVIVAFILLAFGFFTATKQSEFLQNTMRESAVKMTESLAESCTRYLLISDYAGLDELIRRFISMSGASYIQVSRADGKLLSEVGNRPAMIPPLSAQIMVDGPDGAAGRISFIEDQLIIEQPVVSVKVIGWVTITYSLKSIRELRWEIWQETGIAAAIWTVVGIVAFMSIFRRLTGAIQKLSDFARQLGSNKGEQVQVRHSSIEIQQLCQSLNFASVDLLTKEQELKANRDQKEESLRRMAGAIAHNFNNMLGTVMGNLELAIDDAPQGSELRMSITEAMRASQRAAEISRQMLAYLGQTTGERELIDLASTVVETCNLLNASLPKNVTLTTELPLSRPLILADSALIRQILTNLISNAVEAVGEEEGSVAVAIRMMEVEEVRNARLSPPDWEPGSEKYVCISVSDTGSGFEGGSEEKIFDPFFSTKFGGRGLGLPVVLGLVRAHEGGLSVSSELSQGATFKVFLPLAAEREIPSRVEDAPAFYPVEGAGLVLVVDDEPMVRSMSESLLKRSLGHQVITACDGPQALEVFKARKEEISLVLLDLSMPKMDGWQTLEALRALRSDIPVVLTSGHDEAQVMRDSYSEQVQAFLHKPYGAKELKAAIAQAQRANFRQDKYFA